MGLIAGAGSIWDDGFQAYEDIDLVWDSHHSRYVLAWAGTGLDGYGVYVMTVPSGD